MVICYFMFQHPVSVVNDLTYVDGLEDATSCYAHRQLVYCVVSLSQMSFLQHVSTQYGHLQVDTAI
jgi:hypothetical protein